MKNNFLIILYVLIFILMVNLSVGQAKDNPANTGLPFLKLGAGSRAVGMGEAFVAVANDANSAYWNPAGLTQISGTELTFTHNKWLQDITNEFVAVGFRAGNNAFGVSFMSNSIGGIERRVKPAAEPIDVLTAHDIMVGVSYARNFGSNLSSGMTVKYLYQKIYVESSAGVAVDWGLQYQTPLSGLKSGLSLQNFGVVTKLRDESTTLPQTIRLGLAYQLPLHIIQGEFLVAADWMKILASASHVNIGLEYNFIKYFALRLGYQTGFEDKSIHGGFGVQFNRYRLDYAYVPFSSDLGNSHRISVGIKL